jgi:mycofactocin system glycosyltransferase
MRLSPTGARLLDGWVAGEPLGADPAAAWLAARLVDAGLAHPVPPRGPQRDTTIVIPVRDDASGLAATLKSLPAGTARLVVDDGSDIPVPGALRRPTAGGPAAARNSGWREASAEIVVFVDAGCVLDAGCMERLVDHFADPSLAVAAPRVVSRPGNGAPKPLSRYERHHSPLDMGAAPASVRPGAHVSYVPTAVMAVRRSALVASGGFDESLRYGEDVDLVWRLSRAGWRIRYVPAATASHPSRVSWPDWLRQRHGYGRSAAPLAARHGDAVSPLRMSPWSGLAWGLVAAGAPVSGAAVAAITVTAAVRGTKDRRVAAVVARAAAGGNLRAVLPVVSAVRRAWLPPAAALAVASRRAAATLGSILVLPGLADWCRLRPGGDPISWAALSALDDLAYQSGLWRGAWTCRSAAALAPSRPSTTMTPVPAKGNRSPPVPGP